MSRQISTFRISKSQVDFLNKKMVEYGHTPLPGSQLAFMYKAVNGIIDQKKEIVDKFIEAYPWLVNIPLPGEDAAMISSLQKKGIDIQQEQLQVLPDDVTQRLDDYIYDPKMFIPIKTGCIIDEFWSKKGGIMPSTNTMVVGDPGIGKTTITLDILNRIMIEDPTKEVLVISTEMDQVDFYEYKERMPAIGKINIVFMLDYLDFPTKRVLSKELAKGYDIIVTDSTTELLQMIVDSSDCTAKSAESWLLAEMKKNNKGENERNAYTAFINILQATKGGNFVGSNKLKHMTTAFLELRFTKDKKERYCEFSKNRRGYVDNRLYFQPNDTGVQYMEERLKADIEGAEVVKTAQSTWTERAAAFDAVFKADIENAETEAAAELLEAIEELEEVNS